MADGVQKNYPIFLGTTLSALESGILYRGYAKLRTEVETSKAIWLISREYILSGVAHIEHASFHHDQIWDDRASLFPAVVPDPGSPGADSLISTAAKVTVYTYPTAGAEVTHTFLSDTKKFLIKLRNNQIGTFRFSFESGGTSNAAKYFTIADGAYQESNLLLSSFSIYLSVDKNSRTIEVVEWK